MEQTGLKLVHSLFNLSNRPEVKVAVARKTRAEGKKVPQQLDARIQAYFDRLESFLNHPDPQKKERAQHLLKRILRDQYLVDLESIPQSYEDPQSIRKSQENSLQTWEEYLLSEKAFSHYPSWFRYWAFRSILKMGKFDRKNTVFTQRDNPKTTLSPYPDLNQEALSFILGAMRGKLKKLDPEEMEKEINFRADISFEERKDFYQLLQQRTPSFNLLYAWALDKIKRIPEHQLQITQGVWSDPPYQGIEDAPRLVEDIKNHGTGWCIRDLSIAEEYLKEKNLYIYFSYANDPPLENEKPSIPRVVIVQDKESQISEVRGVSDNENLDPYIDDVVKAALMQNKYAEQRSYQKRIDHVQLLQNVERKIANNKPLNKSELTFLYEINEKIMGFGDKRDPRIFKLQETRKEKIREDALILLGSVESPLQSDEIALSIHEVSEKTKVYIGPLFHGMFEQLAHVEHIFREFPGPEIQRQDIKINNLKRKELLSQLKKTPYHITDDTEQFLSNIPQQTEHSLLHKLRNPFRREEAQPKDNNHLHLVFIQLSDFGFQSDPNLSQIFQKAQEFGLELCPPEVGFYLRLKYSTQPFAKWVRIAMNPVKIDGYPCIFDLFNQEDRLWLSEKSAPPAIEWDLDDTFVFQVKMH